MWSLNWLTTLYYTKEGKKSIIVGKLAKLQSVIRLNSCLSGVILTRKRTKVFNSFFLINYISKGRSKRRSRNDQYRYWSSTQYGCEEGPVLLCGDRGPASQDSFSVKKSLPKPKGSKRLRVILCWERSIGSFSQGQSFHFFWAAPGSRFFPKEKESIKSQWTWIRPYKFKGLS